MKSLSKDKVLRWVSGQQSQGGSGGGGVSVDLAGYATQIWTEQNYVNKEFFSSLFKAYDANGNEVLPNDTETVIDNIKAMFGFWTELYVSALGKSPDGQASLFLSSLGDVLWRKCGQRWQRWTRASRSTSPTSPTLSATS